MKISVFLYALFLFIISAAIGLAGIWWARKMAKRNWQYWQQKNKICFLEAEKQKISSDQIKHCSECDTGQIKTCLFLSTK